MSSQNLHRYMKEYLKFQPKTLSYSQIEELIEYDAWLESQSGLTPRAADLPVCTCSTRPTPKTLSIDPNCPVHGSASR